MGHSKGIERTVISELGSAAEEDFTTTHSPLILMIDSDIAGIL